MRKIPTLFVRDPDDRRHVLPDITPGCEWVLAGEGTATRKYDGTCCMYDGTTWWARREVKPGKTPPLGFEPIETDETTGKTVGWEPIGQSGYARFHGQAVDIRHDWPAGTYELCGPKVNGNPEGLERHTLIRHATAERLDDEWDEKVRSYEGADEFLSLHGWEGLVFHHADGRMAKIKRRDFPTN